MRDPNVTVDMAKLNKVLVEAMFRSGAIVMRLVNADKDNKYVPGTYPPYYMRFWGFYWNTWNSFYRAGYYETIKTYTVETNVYSLTRDKLIWSGITSSVNPENVSKLMKAAAKAVFKERGKRRIYCRRLICFNSG